VNKEEISAWQKLNLIIIYSISKMPSCAMDWKI
jgi:hypothetical protein